MRWGEDDHDVIGFGEGIGRGAQPQNLNTFIFVLVRNMDMPAQDA